MTPGGRYQGNLSLQCPLRSLSGPPGAEDGAGRGGQGHRARVKDIVWRRKRRFERRLTGQLQVLPQAPRAIFKRRDLPGDAGKALGPRGGGAIFAVAKPAERAAHGSKRQDHILDQKGLDSLVHIAGHRDTPVSPQKH